MKAKKWNVRIYWKGKHIFSESITASERAATEHMVKQYRRGVTLQFYVGRKWIKEVMC
ncbi:hypothetical protein [Paenibacillus nuruki]|uniref:hypothetical protein n=1 Tax=Paenibacillus nuruki TaxID=1886670 RepID=UPI002803EC00|nr:hypothetical protein [Paenibacillus nuruki]CAJ1315946.1 hypothetical protein AASFL403_12040 [Paenibacillus nuruki]